MQDALDACKGLFTRFDAGDGLCPLRSIGVIVLALERNFVVEELRAILQQLAKRADGALDLHGLCEVVSYVMKGEPYTHDALTLTDRTGCETVVTLGDVAAASLKALYTMHPTFDNERCWLHTDAALASQCTAEGDALAFAGTEQTVSFTIHARDWVRKRCPGGGEFFEVRLRGPATIQGDVSDNGDGTYTATFAANISGAYSLSVTLARQHIAGSPFSVTVDADQTRPEYCVAQGGGLSAAEAGKPATFTIFKRDRFGHPRLRGVDHFYADVQVPGRARRASARAASRERAISRAGGAVRVRPVAYPAPRGVPGVCGTPCKAPSPPLIESRPSPIGSASPHVPHHRVCLIDACLTACACARVRLPRPFDASVRACRAPASGTARSETSAMARTW